MADHDADYITLGELKPFIGVELSDVTNDPLYSSLITAASRHVDNICNRRFYVPTTAETRNFDLPTSDTLWFDEDLLSVSSVTNGDGTSVAASAYVLLPANTTPKYALKLKSSGSVTWQQASAGDTEQVIAVAGDWGYSEEAPPEIKQAVKLMIALSLSPSAGSAQNSNVIRQQIGEYEVEFRDFPTENELPNEVRTLLLPKKRTVFA